MVERYTSEYNSWQALKQRCYNPNRRYYHRYGGRGIKVCNRWLGNKGFENFLADMGNKPTPQHTIERINTNKNYEPGNCKWATWKEQQNNRGPRRIENSCRRGHPRVIGNFSVASNGWIICLVCRREGRKAKNGNRARSV